MKSRLALVSVVVLSLVAAERPAYAYIDPGSASYFFQILIGGAVGAMFFLRTFWTRLKESARERLSRVRGGR